MTIPLTEAAFLRAVLDLAHLRGFETWHPRPARTMDSWRTAGSGTMAKGFPDLLLVHPEQRRLLFVELKTDTGRLTADQERVLSVLREIESEPHPKWQGTGTLGEISVQVRVFRPRDWDAIEEVLA